MHIDKAKLVSALSKAKAKAKQKMTRAPPYKASNQPDRSQAVDNSSSTWHFSEHEVPSDHEVHPDSLREPSELLTAEDMDDLQHMLKHDFAALSAEQYRAEIQPLVDELLTFMNRQDALDCLG